MKYCFSLFFLFCIRRNGSARVGAGTFRFLCLDSGILLRDGEHRLQGFQYLIPSCAVLAGETDNLPGLYQQCPADGGQLFLTGTPADLVALGGNHRKRDIHLPQELVHLNIILGGFVADIHQTEDVLKFTGGGEIVLHHLSPAELLLLIDLGKPVAGQVYKMKAFVEKKDVDQPGLSRRGTGAGKFTAACDAVDETAFAHIAFAHHCDLGQPDAGEVPVGGQGDDEISAFNFHPRFPSHYR